MKNCYIYTRVSTAAQTEGYSLEAQQEALREYAKYRDLNIVGDYCDAGKSGKNIKGRPAFLQMMEDVVTQKDEISFVLVFKLSRFGRNTADILRSIQKLTDFGVDLVSVNESIDSSTQGGRLTLAILSAVAEMERENITSQFMAGKQQKILNGDWSGGTVPYGYRNVDHKLVTDAYEVEVIKKVFELYEQEGSTASSVANVLNESAYVRRDMQTDGTKPFNYEFVARTLDNPFYCGRLCYNRRTNKKDHNGKIIKKEPDTSIVIKGNHESVISEEVWDRVHDKRVKMAERYKKSAESVHTHILSGLVKCPVCGKNLVGSISKSRNLAGDGYYDKAIYYYICRHSSRQNGKICSFNKRLNEEIIDGLIFEVLSNLQFYKEFKLALNKASATVDTVESMERKLQSLRTELRDAEITKNRLGEQLDGLNPLNPGYDKKYSQVSLKLNASYDRIDELEDLIEDVRKRTEALRTESNSIIQVTDFLGNLGNLLVKMTEEEKKELCSSFIEQIEIFPEERADGKIIKNISFKFPVAFDGKELRKVKDSDEGISFTLDCSNIDIELPEKGNIKMKELADGSRKVVVRKPTYKALREFVFERYGAHVSTLNIAQTKRKYGVDIGTAYNKPDEPKARVPRCTAEKEKMILEAFKHFDLLEQDTKYKEGE